VAVPQVVVLPVVAIRRPVAVSLPAACLPVAASRLAVGVLHPVLHPAAVVTVLPAEGSLPAVAVTVLLAVVLLVAARPAAMVLRVEVSLPAAVVTVPRAECLPAVARPVVMVLRAAVLPATVHHPVVMELLRPAATVAASRLHPAG
jgi:hypothetical protein